MLKNRKFWIILSVVLVIVISVVTTLTVVLVNKNKNEEDKPSDDNPSEVYVTVTFESNGGSDVEAVSVLKGSTIDNLPQSYLAGYAFIGWFLDEELTQTFTSGSVVDEDISLYAGFVESDNDLVEAEQTSQFEEGCLPDMAVQFISDKDYTEEEFLKSIQIEAVSGELPEEFSVYKDGKQYTLKARNGYSAGKMYKITLPENIRFKDFSEEVNEFTFRINKEKSAEVELNQDIHYVMYSDLHDYAETAGGYQLTFKVKSDEVDAFFQFKAGDVICVGPERKYDYEESAFVKISDISTYTQKEIIPKIDEDTLEVTNEEIEYTYYHLNTVDADVEDVYSLVDVMFEDTIPASAIIEQIDVEEITDSVYASGAFDKVTTLVATLLSESDSVKTSLGYGTSQQSNNAPDFTQNAYIIDGTLKNVIKCSIADGAKVTISVGEGYNPNFSANYSDNFVVLKASFTYNATVKKKVKIKVEFTLVEYVAVTMQGCLDYEYPFLGIGDKWLYFDYALNIYSQTDIDMSIMICSADDDDYRDISQEIKDKLSKDNEDDPDNLVKQLQEMLDSESGDIELFRTNLLHIDYKIIPIVPIMQVNIDFDFLVKMNFAAGLSTDISLLEATQVGVTGDTREDYIRSYKHELYGGNRYSVELTACGYVGIKAGFEGGLSISFCGLSKLGKVGVYVFVGPYVDLYGFARLTLAKDRGSAKASLVGGYYIEVGINLEITLEARSDLFKVKVGVTLLDVKWPLVSFGNKEVLLSIEGSNLDDVFVAGEAGDLDIGEYNTATLSLYSMSPLKGKYIDITTGDTVLKDIPWGNVHLTFSNYKFTLDPATKIITYKNGNYPRPASEECTVNYYYTGPCLQFNLSSSQSQDYYPFGTSRIVYYDKSIVSQDVAGNYYTANVYTVLDGEKTLVDSYSVLAGSCLRFVETGINIYQYMDISWNKDPKDTYVVEDTDFIQYGYSRQTFVAFIYYEEGEDALDPGTWYTEIRAVDLGEKPVVPTLPDDGDKTKFTGWYVTTNSHEYVGSEIMTSLSADEMKVRYVDDYYTHGFDTSKPFDKYKNESSATIYLELWDHYREDYDIYWKAVVNYIYTATYEEEDCVLTTVTNIADNEWHTGYNFEDSYTLEYGHKLYSYSTLTELKYRFIGFSYTDGGEPEISTNISELPKIYKDLTLYMIYEPIIHDVTLQYYDDVKGEYVNYASYKIGRNCELGLLDIDYEGAAAELVRVDGVEYQLMCWQYRYEGQKYKDYATEDSRIFHDIEIYPIYRRKVSITLTPGEGEETIASLEGYYTDSVFDYTTYVGNLCYKEPDERYTYPHTHWKNTSTGEVYPINKVYADYPATFEAVFTPTEKIYTLTIETTKGVLENGEQSLVFNYGYDRYIECVEKYLNITLDDILDEENHCSYKQNGLSKYVDNDGYVYLIKYDQWEKVLNTYTVTIDENGGEAIFATNDSGEQIYSYENRIGYGSNFYLTNVYAEKVTDLAIYKLVGWVDDDDNFYATDATYVVLKDTTFKASWEFVSYCEYSITYILNDEKYDERTYHFDDVIDLSQPQETLGLVFDGWHLYYATDEVNEIGDITKMPNKNLVAKAYSNEVFIYYYVDGNEISKSHGDVQGLYQVEDKYIKKGYTVTDWQTSDVSISNNSFVMPAKDVVFTSTTSINSYTLTYSHDNRVYKEETIQYGTFILLIETPNDESGITYDWDSEDVNLTGTGFTMPDHNVLITSTQVVKTVRIVYYVGDTVYSILATRPGKNVILIDKPEGVDDWYINNEPVTSIVVPDTDVFVYSEYKDIKYTITFDVDAGLEYDGEYYVDVVAGERYELPEAPTLDSYMSGSVTDGWYSIDAEILTENGTQYIIMPAYDVYIHAFAYPDNTGGNVATTYLVLDTEKVEFLKYNVVDNEVPIYFEYPSVNGYQFVHWEDSDGTIYDENNGITLNSMNGVDRDFYAVYRKVELHTATFILDGEIVGYDVFYDYSFVTLNTPTVTLSDNKEFSGWINPYVSLVDFGNGGIIYLNEESSPIGMDFVFQGFTYEIGTVTVNIDCDGVKAIKPINISVNEEQTIKLLSSHLDTSVSYAVKAYGYSEETGSVEYETCNVTIEKEGDYYLITLPNTRELSNDGMSLEFNYFVIVVTK